MRKSIIIAALLSLVLFTGWSVTLGSWVSFTGGGNPSSPQIEVLGSDGAQTTVHITVPGMLVEEKEVNGQTYQVLRLPDDYATMLNVGEPELPAIRKLVGIPPTCNVSVTVVSQSYTELEGYLVYPFQEPLKGGEEPGPFVIDTTLYGTDSFYPQGIAEVGTPTVWRDVRVTRLSLYPATFNPVTGILRIYDDLTVQLNYSGTDGVNPLVNPPDEVSPSFNQMYKSALINYGYLNLNISDLPLGYLIISPEKYCLSILPLANWKRKKGIPTFIGEVAEGCDTSAVRDTIAQYYENYGIEYVLLVGNEDDIPTKNYHEDWDGVSQEIYSDFWYTLITDNDTIPDVAIGRLPAHSETDVSTMVNKIFSYERNPDPDWTVNKAIMVAHRKHDDLNPGLYRDCKRYIGYTIMANSDFDVDSLFGAVSGVCNEDVINAFQSSDGLGIVNYFGHGTAGGRSWEQWNRCGFPPGEYFGTLRCR